MDDLPIRIGDFPVHFKLSYQKPQQIFVLATRRFQPMIAIFLVPKCPSKVSL